MSAERRLVNLVASGARRIEREGVVAGAERPIAARPAPIEPSRWHDLVVRARGDHIVVEWNGQPLIDAG